MRNLKKILALVLALMMVLSVMVTASAASFADADEINADYTEAVEVLSAIGVIDGFKNDDDSYDFQPDGTLNRAQAAKIVAYILTGDLAEIEETADAIDLPFTDVPNWAKPYVAYCYNAGIINGRNATTYDPNGKVTGYEFGKMLLIAAGLANNSYFVSTVYTVNGVAYTDYNMAALAATTTGGTIEVTSTAYSDWKVTVASLLKDNSLWAGATNDFSLAKQLTREEACYLAFNAIMYYNPAIETLADSLYGANFGGKVETVWIEKNAAVETDCVTIAGELTTGYVYDTVTGAIDSTAFSVYAETGLDMIGHVANVYYYTDRYTSYDIAYTVVDKSNVVELGSYDLFGATTAQAAAKLGIYSSQVAATTYAMAEYDRADNAAAETSGQDSVLFNAYGSYWIVPAGTYIVYGGKIVSYMTETTTVEKLVVTVDDAVKGYYTVGDGSDADKYVKVNTNTVGNLNYDMLVTDEAIDWLGLFTDATYRQSATESVLYVVAQYGDYYQLSPVETVTGKVTKLNTAAASWSAGKGIYVDGVQYAYTDIYNTIASIAAPGAATIGATPAPNFTSTYTFYLDGYGTIFAYTTAGADVVDQNMVFPVTVYSVATNPVYNDYGAVVVPAGNTYWMQAVTMDGTEVLLQLTDETFAGYLTTATPGTATSTTAGTYYTVSGSGASTAVSVKNVAVGGTIASGDKVVDTSAAALNKLYTYVVSYNSTLKANVATLTAVDSISTDLADSGDVYANWTTGDKSVTDAASGGSKYYVNDSYTVMYVSGATTTLKTVQVAANNQLLTAGTLVYGVAQNATEASNGNYDLKYVVIRGAAPDAAGSGIIYATGAFTTNNAVPYTNALGATATAYEQKVYIDGVATTILTLGVNEVDGSTAVAAGCYTYTVDAQGIYHLTAYAYDVATEVSSIYNGMITDASSITDLDVTGVKVVNLISANSDPTDYAATASITSGEQLYAGCDIVIVKQWNGVAMVPALIYLTNVNP